tara:strand:+ start:21850 stop:22101 length:252 start_codon:yes stop_codon:yes gene_type:complete
MVWYGVECGDLVRWISDWHIYAVDSLGDVHGERPMYSYGVVLENYDKVGLILVYCHSTKRRTILNLDMLDCEVISRVQKKIDI